MGAGGVTNCGTNATDARSLKKTGKPNSKVQRYNQKGELVQERRYDYLGRAIRNRDYSQSQRGKCLSLMIMTGIGKTAKGRE